MTTETQDPAAPAKKKKRKQTRMPAAPAAGAGAAPIESFALIVGAMKSGTTSLYHYLAAHPEIATGRKKEPDFFADARNWRRGPEAYYALWPEFDPSRHRYALEASTNYTKYPQRRGAPHRMQRLAETHGARFKFLYVLRNPIDRIESHLAHNIARRDAGRAVDAENIEAALAVSRYAAQLERFTRRFPREDLLLLDFDDLREDPRGFVARALAFLGLPPGPDFEVRPPANVRRDANGSAAFRLDDARRAAVRAALRADVTELRDRFGVEVGKWDIL